MIQSPADFLPALDLELHDDAVVHLFVRDALVQSLDEPRALPWRTWRAMGFRAARVQPIGRHLGVDHIAVALPDDHPADLMPDGWRAANLRNWFGALDDETVAIGMRAVQMLEWDRTHRFCGACGTPTEQMPGERAKRCPACRLSVYPRISPAMMTLVTDGDRVLLGRGVNFPPGRYSALAGFVEAGESIEDCVTREVREETNVRVGNLRYFGSQSWPFPNSLMIAFTAEYAGGELRHDPAELADARWFHIDELPQLPPRHSISRALIDATVRRLRTGS